MRSVCAGVKNSALRMAFDTRIVSAGDPVLTHTRPFCPTASSKAIFLFRAVSTVHGGRASSDLASPVVHSNTYPPSRGPNPDDLPCASTHAMAGSRSLCAAVTRPRTACPTCKLGRFRLVAPSKARAGSCAWKGAPMSTSMFSACLFSTVPITMSSTAGMYLFCVPCTQNLSTFGAPGLPTATCVCDSLPARVAATDSPTCCSPPPMRIWPVGGRANAVSPGMSTSPRRAGMAAASAISRS
mmetsp:Transcript_13058/g.41263  ORF Transcript_13058/g.41263 Transcript_13058/m.41263 type:complete len:241 (+) Transcript_13058:47-769(+)